MIVLKSRKTLVTILVCTLVILSFNMTYARIYFYDVFGHWAEESIMWGANTVKLLNGYVDGSFIPDGNISRSEYVSLLYRTASRQGIINETDEDSSTNDTQITSNDIGYLDIKHGYWAYDDIATVMSFIDSRSDDIKFKDIFHGDHFLPNEKITRGEAAVLTYFFTSPSIKSEDIIFTDIDFDYKYYDKIISLANNDIITGNPDGTFKPTNNITRAEAVTIIRRLYDDMEYQKKSYLGDIRLLDINSTIQYPLFGDYTNKELDTNDLLYLRAIETLEYKSLVGIIPFEEQHLYDSNPMGTIEKLKDNKYENIIGMNYYLIKNSSSTYSNKTQLIQEIFTSYANGALISDEEFQFIVNQFSDQVENIDLLFDALERWESTATSEEIKNNAIFMKSKVYILAGDAVKAIELYEDINSLSANVRMMQLMNKSHILIFFNEYDSAEKILTEGWEQVKTLDGYIFDSKEYDTQFRGALKEIARIKDN